MKPIEMLINEHGLIRHFLDNLAVAQLKLEMGIQIPRKFFDHTFDFIDLFIDRYHHFREEHIMFVQLAQKKEGAIDSQIEALRYQHERSRNFVSMMAKCLNGYFENEPKKTTNLIESTSAYVSLLRHHIYIEDHVFYPLAVKVFSESDMKRLEDEFERQKKKTSNSIFEDSYKNVVNMGTTLVDL